MHCRRGISRNVTQNVQYIIKRSNYTEKPTTLYILDIYVKLNEINLFPYTHFLKDSFPRQNSIRETAQMELTNYYKKQVKAIVCGFRTDHNSRRQVTKSSSQMKGL